jgi:hypothetical protein
VFAYRKGDRLLGFSVHQVNMVGVHRDHFPGLRQRSVDDKMQVRTLSISRSVGRRNAAVACANADRDRAATVSPFFGARMIGPPPAGECAMAIPARRSNQQMNEVAHFI